MIGDFVDISSFQGVIDWQAYATYSKIVAMKATEGVGYTDPQFKANQQGALNAGVEAILYYHFGRPNLGNTATDEANWFHSVVGPIRESDQIVLDLEVNAPSVATWAQAWLSQQEQNYGGKLPWLYSYLQFIENNLQYPPLGKYPLWMAEYTYDQSARPACPSPWSSYIALQYTDRATNIPGIQGSVDADIFLGGAPMQGTYGPNSSDFDTYFTVDANGNWVCKQTNMAIIGSNKELFSRLSMDGQTLPIIGLPLENEQYTGDRYSEQQFERGTVVYDPNNGQPGINGTSHLKIINPPQTQTVVAIPAELKTRIDTNATLSAEMQKIADGLPTP